MTAHRSPVLTAILTLAALVFAFASRAANPAWGNTNGNFTNAALWSTAAVPTAGDTAWLTNNITTGRTASNDSSVVYGNLVLSNATASTTMTLLLVSNASMTVGGNAVVGNNGILSLVGGGLGTAGSVMTNGNLALLGNGTLRFAPAGGINTSTRTFVVTNGFANAAEASLDFNNSGNVTLLFAANAVVTNNGTISSRLNSGANPLGTNTIRIANTNLLLNTGTVDLGLDNNPTTGVLNRTLFLEAGMVNRGGVVLSNAPSVRLGAFSRTVQFTVVGSVTNESAGVWRMVGGLSNSVQAAVGGSGFINLGTFSSTMASSPAFRSNMLVLSAVGGLFSNAPGGVVSVENGPFLLQADQIVNAGTNTIQLGAKLFYQNRSGGAGALLNSGLVDLQGGSLVVATVTNASAGTVKGTGTLQANLVNGGLLAPGNSPGALTNQGNLTLLSSSVFQLELGGTGQGTTYDFLQVNGTASLTGRLDVLLYGGFVPQATDVFTGLTASVSLAGSFTNLFASGPNWLVNVYSNDVAYGTMRVQELGNNLVLDQFLSTIPEPSMLLVTGAGLVLLAALHRRRAA